MPKYTLAHPLDKGNPFLKDGKAANAGDVVDMNENSALHLAAAGYLNLEDDGRTPKVADSKPA